MVSYSSRSTMSAGSAADSSAEYWIRSRQPVTKGAIFGSMKVRRLFRRGLPTAKELSEEFGIPLASHDDPIYKVGFLALPISSAPTSTPSSDLVQDEAAEPPRTEPPAR